MLAHRPMPLALDVVRAQLGFDSVHEAREFASSLGAVLTSAAAPQQQAAAPSAVAGKKHGPLKAPAPAAPDSIDTRATGLLSALASPSSQQQQQQPAT